MNFARLPRSQPQKSATPIGPGRADQPFRHDRADDLTSRASGARTPYPLTDQTRDQLTNNAPVQSNPAADTGQLLRDELKGRESELTVKWARISPAMDRPFPAPVMAL